MELAPGLIYYPDFYSRDEQEALVAALRTCVKEAPLFTPRMPRTGKPFSVRMTNCGALGWVSDEKRGYRYQATHPVTGKTWPPIFPSLLNIWNEITHNYAEPEACLINYYLAIPI